MFLSKRVSIHLHRPIFAGGSQYSKVGIGIIDASSDIHCLPGLRLQHILFGLAGRATIIEDASTRSLAANLARYVLFVLPITTDKTDLGSPFVW